MRPTCSATGASTLEATLVMATFSQRSSSGVMFVTSQILGDPIEIGPPVVAHDHVAAVQLDAGGQCGVDTEFHEGMGPERPADGIADASGVHGRERLRGDDVDGTTTIMR